MYYLTKNGARYQMYIFKIPHEHYPDLFRKEVKAEAAEQDMKQLVAIAALLESQSSTPIVQSADKLSENVKEFIDIIKPYIDQYSRFRLIKKTELSSLEISLLCCFIRMFKESLKHRSIEHYDLDKIYSSWIYRFIDLQEYHQNNTFFYPGDQIKLKSFFNVIENYISNHPEIKKFYNAIKLHDEKIIEKYSHLKSFSFKLRYQLAIEWPQLDEAAFENELLSEKDASIKNFAYYYRALSKYENEDYILITDNELTVIRKLGLSETADDFCRLKILQKKDEEIAKLEEKVVAQEKQRKSLLSEAYTLLETSESMLDEDEASLFHQETELLDEALGGSSDFNSEAMEETQEALDYGHAIISQARNRITLFRRSLEEKNKLINEAIASLN